MNKQKTRAKWTPKPMDNYLAELYGAMIGDGCLSKYFSNYDQREKYCVLLTGHTHDKQYYRKTIQPIFHQLFGIKGCIRFKRKDNVVRFETISKKVFDFFVNLGFPIGLKRGLKIPKEILQERSLAIACIRGIFDTDGSVYRRYSKRYSGHSKRYNYLNVEIKMNSEEIINKTKQVLDSENIGTPKVRKRGKAYIINIIKQNSVNKFFEIIQPSNQYHVERFLNLR